MTALSLKAKVEQKRDAIASDIQVIGRDSNVVKHAYNNGGFNNWGN